jgi:flagellar protein FliJ
MKKFTLQRILELKRRKEQASAARLVETRTAVDLARHSEAQMEAVRRDGAASVSGGKARGVTAGQLQSAAMVLSSLDRELDLARLATRAAEAEVRSSLAEFTSASQERQVLEKLRDRHLETALAAERSEETNQLDEVALSRFFRRDPRAGGGAG